MEKRYLLKCADDITFEVGSAVISCCELLSFVIEDCAEAIETEKNGTILIPSVKSKTLQDVINLVEIMGSQPERCEEFLLNLDVTTFLGIVDAADYLICEDILDMVSKVVSGKNWEDSIMEDSIMERVSMLRFRKPYRSHKMM